MDSYIEQSVSGKRNAGSSFLYVICWCATALLVILAMFFGTGVFGDNPAALEINWLNVALMVVCLAAALGCFRRKDYLRMEYDYILRGTTLEISGILNARRRRVLAEIPLESILQMGLTGGEAQPKLLSNSRIKKHSWFISENVPVYYLIYRKDNDRHMALLELNEEMLAAMRKSGKLARDAWRNEEGKTANYASLS